MRFMMKLGEGSILEMLDVIQFENWYHPEDDCLLGCSAV
jgi:hypothetical protein